MNSQDKLGLTVCYRTDDEDDIGIYISEVLRLILYNYRSRTERLYSFLPSNVLSSSGLLRCLWKDTGRFLCPLYHTP